MSTGLRAMKMNKADVIVDLQFGSTGKGLICGWLARTGQYDTVVAANMPNAGHTYIENGRKWVHKALPSGIFVSKNIMIGPGSVFDPERLAKEIEDSADILAGKRIVIHESAGILSDAHRTEERSTLSRISSTMQGSAACLKQKISREDGVIAGDCRGVLRHYGLEQYIVNQWQWLKTILGANKILVEGSQGYSLGLSAGFYPYCTSRECTASRVMADCGIPPGMLYKVIGTARCHPIRVGNTSDGHSGSGYWDQIEISWADLGVAPETTTVTGRIRRVFTFSDQQIREAVIANCVDEVFLNFANYDIGYAGEVVRAINDICSDLEIGQGVTMIGMGPDRADVMPAKAFKQVLTDWRASGAD